MIAKALHSCTLCPRACHANRSAGQKGVCAVTGTAVQVARVALHAWEEPCISGKGGSGTVFFCGCNLHCRFCQNEAISCGKGGTPYSVFELCQAYLSLQAQGAENINLVTAGHYAIQVSASLRMAKEQGLRIPVVFNCGGYETEKTLSLFAGLVDVYLPDFKFWNSAQAKMLANAPDYPTVARKALHTMVAQTGPLQFSSDGMLQKGVLVRHLILPGYTRFAKQILSYLFRTYQNQIGYSLLHQYTPMPHAVGLPNSLQRPLYEEEYQVVVSHAQSLGLQTAYVQTAQSVGEAYIPSFL